MIAELSIDYRCLACSEMEDNYCFHTITPSKLSSDHEEFDKLIKVCFENLSTNTDIENEARSKLHPLTVFPDKPETNIPLFEEVVHYEP